MSASTMVSKKRKTTIADSVRVRPHHHEENLAGDDRINDLPTPILNSIISLLPLKEALATSLVCRRWRYLWLYLTRLDLDSSCIRFASKDGVWSSTSGGGQAVYSQRNKFISSCRIVILNDIAAGRVSFEEEKQWLDFLKNRKGLENLTIAYREKGILPNWPTGFYNGSHLRVVELENKLMGSQDVSSFEGCVNLETLKLTTIFLKEETLFNIIHNCTNLENLALISCNGLIEVRIQHQCLKQLKIDSLHLTSFNLHCQSLTILSLSNFRCSSNNINCPNLGKLRSHHNSSDLLARFIGLLGCKDTNYVNLLTIQSLHTSFNLEDWYDLILLRFILRAWIYLQQLYIVNKVCDEDDTNSHRTLPSPGQMLFWAGESTDSILYHLKVVEIKGFRGKEKEMLMVCHLIKNAQVLEKLVIQFENPCDHRRVKDAKRELLSLPRASNNASIVFNV